MRRRLEKRAVRRINHLTYADDVVLLAENEKRISRMKRVMMRNTGRKVMKRNKRKKTKKNDVK